jgi:hypothetical protein
LAVVVAVEQIPHKELTDQILSCFLSHQLVAVVVAQRLEHARVDQVVQEAVHLGMQVRQRAALELQDKAILAVAQMGQHFTTVAAVVVLVLLDKIAFSKALLETVETAWPPQSQGHQ